MSKADFIIIDDPCENNELTPHQIEYINKFWDECIAKRLSMSDPFSTNAETANSSENT